MVSFPAFGHVSLFVLFQVEVPRGTPPRLEVLHFSATFFADPASGQHRAGIVCNTTQ